MTIPRAIDGAAVLGAMVAGVVWPASLIGSVPALLGVHALAAWHPRATWYGPVVWRMPWPDAIALTFDDGPHPEVTPRVLDQLAEAGAQATFCVIGENVRRHPGLVRRMIAAGHTVAVHSDQHRWTFNLRGRVSLLTDLNRAIAVVAEVSGVRPLWFRPPVGLRNPLVHEVAAALGLRVLTWTANARDTQPGNPTQLAARLCRRMRPGAILVLHDGHEPWRSADRSRCLDILPLVLAAARTRGCALRGL